MARIPRPPAGPSPAPGAESTRLTSRSRKGLVGRNWWAQQTSRILGDVGLPDRLHRARALARAGGVVGFRMVPGHLSAEIRQPRNLPREASITIPIFTPAEQERIVEVFSSQARWSAELLMGHLSEDASRELEERGVHLIPSAWADLESECACEDPSPVCPHVAAVFYLAIEGVDRDPHRLFELRGLDRDDFLRRCREERVARKEAALEADGTSNTGTDTAESPDDDPSSSDGDDTLKPGQPIEARSFWGRTEDLRSIVVEVDSATGDPPALSRLGLPPSIEPDSIPEAALRDAYRLADETVQEIAERIGIEIRGLSDSEEAPDPKE